MTNVPRARTYICLMIGLIFACIFYSCNGKEINSKVELIEADGIFFENLVKDSTDELNPFNADNIIYLPGRKFVYDYRYIDTLDNEYKFRREGYELTPINHIDSSTIVYISLMATKDNKMFGDYPEFKQTEVSYEYYLINDESIYPREGSGLVENRKNIWVHPFRGPRYFRILNLNPYPFIKKPYSKGNEWEYCLKVGGSAWFDPAWKEHEGNVEFCHRYKIKDIETIDTKLGRLNILKIEAIGESIIGQTKLVSYFNEQYGFVKLDYTNINGFKTVLDLIEVIEPVD